MTSYLAATRRLTSQTPPDRNRVVDLMRVVSILVVVFGHWLMAAVTIEDGALDPGHLLELTSWTHPLTWVLQVMPIFFFVGGYSNALSWRSARRRAESYGSWLRSRLRRLTLPVVPLLLVWGVGGALAIGLGLDWELLQMASQVALVPTWFLAAYVIIVALVPPTLWLWERFGWWTISLGLALVATADVVSIAFGFAPAALLNYVFVWGTVHQLGYAWVDGAFRTRLHRMGLALAGFGGVLALVWAGPYPVAMVGLVGGLNNSQPPRLTLTLLGVFQAGLILVLEPYLARLMERRAAWTGVIAVSAQIMTLYLWHMTSMVLVIAASLALGGFGFGIEPVTSAWWLTRPVWFALLCCITLLLAIAFGRFERPQADPRPAPALWRPLVAVASTCAGLGLLATSGVAGPDGVNGLILTLPVAGMVLGGVIGVTYNRIAA